MRNSILLLCFLSLFSLQGCAGRITKDRAQISRALEQTTGQGIGPVAKPGEVRIPAGVQLADGLSPDEAVALALWNYPPFQEDLASLGFAEADLIEAGLLTNPILSLLFPLGPKQLELTVTTPIEALWQRPRRLAAARLGAERLAEQLVQHGLDLAGEVKSAHVEVALAKERARLARERASIHSAIAEISNARLRAGDISELEMDAARAQALKAEEEVTRLMRDVEVATHRLRALLGMASSDIEFEIVATRFEAKTPGDVGELLSGAFAARPDLRAAELALEEAGKRLGWERSKVYALSVMLDANSQGREGFEAGPGLAAVLPLFNTNQGGVKRAETGMEVAARRYVTVQQRIVLEVREARTRLEQSTEALEKWRRGVVPLAENIQTGARKAYESGEASYLLVLETTRELFDARLREAELAADARRALVQLERATGKRWP